MLWYLGDFESSGLGLGRKLGPGSVGTSLSVCCQYDMVSHMTI